MWRIFSILVLLSCSTFVYADKFLPEASYKVCFTPAEQCTDLVVATINQAQKTILVQAYSFTSRPIAKALIQAHKRGVNVKVILDKSQSRGNGFSPGRFLSDYHIPVLIDYKPRIAHNKVMIIDNKQIITGSFNFTRAAEEKNAENVIIITDTELAKKYTANWQQRAAESKGLEENFTPFD